MTTFTNSEAMGRRQSYNTFIHGGYPSRGVIVLKEVT